MSARDYDLYQRELSPLRGRRCFVTLATNSIKLHIDENKKKGTFLWLDPPWTFCRNGILIESSASCPDHSEPDYKSRFRRWCSRFDSIFETTINDLTATPDGALEIAFDGGHEIVLPADQSKQTDSWYDHWYFRDPEKGI
jgi:hypothetical protein